MRKKSEIQFLGVFGRPENRRPAEKKIRDPIFRGLQTTGGSLKTRRPTEKGAGSRLNLGRGGWFPQTIDPQPITLLQLLLVK